MFVLRGDMIREGEREEGREGRREGGWKGGRKERREGGKFRTERKQ